MNRQMILERAEAEALRASLEAALMELEMRDSEAERWPDEEDFFEGDPFDDDDAPRNEVPAHTWKNAPEKAVRRYVEERG